MIALILPFAHAVKALFTQPKSGKRVTFLCGNTKKDESQPELALKHKIS